MKGKVMEREKHRDRKKELLHPLVYSPNVDDSKDWAMMQSRVRTPSVPPTRVAEPIST